MSRTATGQEYLYVDCPSCNQGIAEPFSIDSGPVPFVHGHGTNRCRIIVWPDPEKREARSWPVPRNKSLEEALTIAKNAARLGGWRSYWWKAS